MTKRLPLNLATSLLVGAYMMSSAASASTQLVVDDLLTASNMTTAWLECGTDSTGVDVANLDAGGCAYRTTPAEPGVTYRMSCGIQVFKAASITLAFLDAEDNELAKEVTEILEHVSGAYSATLQAPAGTATAAIGIYGEPGSAFQDCVLVDVSPAPEPTKGSIAGTTWFDDSGDLEFDATEPSIASVPVTLFFEGTQIAQTVTDAEGEYYFGNLDIDSCYTVSFEPVDTTLELAAAGGSNDAGTNGVTQEICLTELTPDVTAIDAGFVAIPPVEPPADLVICGTAWVDADESGRANTGDYPFENVTVNLIQDGKSIATTTSNAKGRYVFRSLPAGSYSVRMDTPDGHEAFNSTSTPKVGRSLISADSATTPVITIAQPIDPEAVEHKACTITQINGGFVKLEVALDPTVANDDSAENFVGTNFSVDILANDDACDGVNELSLMGHNVPGSVVINPNTQQIDVSNTTAEGVYSIQYAVRGQCGSLDTATVEVLLVEVPVIVADNAPAAPVCRVETGGSTRIGGVDVFNATQDGFAAEYNMYDRDKNLVITNSSSDFTHLYLIDNTANQNEIGYVNNWEMEWNGTKYGYDQVSIHYVSAVEAGIESELTRCDRLNISPIALDLDGNGRIKRVVGNFEIDMNNDGINEALSQWFAPSAGILVTDDAKGQISGQQLFGNIPGVYADGFAELATYDANEDGVLKSDELVGLAIWNDLNSDTKVDDGELSSLADHQIVSLAVDHYKFMARATKSNGKSILMEDVWFPQAPMAALAK